VASRRASRRGDEQNLDSLLDTMANVTGILVVMLAVTQISMGDAMGRLRDLLAARPELTAESLAHAEDEAETLRLALAPLLAAEEEFEARRRAGREDVAALRAGNAERAAEIEAARDADPDLLRARTRDAAGREQALRGALHGARAELASLEARAAAITEHPLAREIRLPDPRPAPAGAREVHVLVRYGRALVIDERTLIDELYGGIARALDAPIDRLSLSVLPIHQRIRLRSHFDRLPIGAQGLRWRIDERGREIVGVLEWRRETVGETAAELSLASSDFRRELRRISPHRAYLRYLVWADSFETYLAARAASDAEDFAAGFTAFEEHVPIVQPLTRNVSNRRFVD
jgi:hypothetical protein